MNAVVVMDIFKAPFWGGDVAMEQFFGGLGVGLFLLSVLLHLWFGENGKVGARIAALTAPICIVIGSIFLILHLGQPLRFPLAFLNFNVTSPLSWGSWLQFLFGLTVFAYAWSWLKEDREKLKSLCVKIGIPLAIGTGFYHGFILMALRAHPMWNTGPIVIMTFAGFALSAVSLLAILLIAMGKKGELKSLSVIRNFTGIVIIAQLLTLFLWLSSLFFGTGEAHFMLIRFLTIYGYSFWIGVVVIGLIVPLIMGGLSSLGINRDQPVVIPKVLVSSILILSGSCLFRFLILMAEQ